MNYWLLLILMVVSAIIGGIMFNHVGKKISLLDLVTRNDRLSTTKILQLVGGIVGTWIVIKLTVTTGISWDIFSIYLAYVASVDGFSKVITAKFGQQEQRGGGYNYSRPQSYSTPHFPAERSGSMKTPEE